MGGNEKLATFCAPLYCVRRDAAGVYRAECLYQPNLPGTLRGLPRADRFSTIPALWPQFATTGFRGEVVLVESTPCSFDVSRHREKV